jgi:hypothetical protein
MLKASHVAARSQANVRAINVRSAAARLNPQTPSVGSARLQVCQEGQNMGHDRVNSDASPTVIQTWQ